MPKAMSSDPAAPPVHGEMLTGIQRRRRWSTTEKIRFVEESQQLGSSVSFVAPLRHLTEPAVLVEAAHAGGRSSGCASCR